jgi:hypothetical protein
MISPGKSTIMASIEEQISRLDSFIEVMKDQFRANAHKGDWRERTIHHPGGTDEPVTTTHALVRLREELRELQLAVETGQEPEVVAREAADVANFALIVADLYSLDPTWRLSGD